MKKIIDEKNYINYFDEEKQEEENYNDDGISPMFYVDDLGYKLYS